MLNHFSLAAIIFSGKKHWTNYKNRTNIINLGEQSKTHKKTPQVANYIFSSFHFSIEWFMIFENNYLKTIQFWPFMQYYMFTEWHQNFYFFIITKRHTIDWSILLIIFFHRLTELFCAPRITVAPPRIDQIHYMHCARVHKQLMISDNKKSIKKWFV